MPAPARRASASLQKDPYKKRRPGAHIRFWFFLCSPDSDFIKTGRSGVCFYSESVPNWSNIRKRPVTVGRFFFQHIPTCQCRAGISIGFIGNRSFPIRFNCRLYPIKHFVFISFSRSCFFQLLSSATLHSAPQRGAATSTFAVRIRLSYLLFSCACSTLFSGLPPLSQPSASRLHLCTVSSNAAYALSGFTFRSFGIGFDSGVFSDHSVFGIASGYQRTWVASRSAFIVYIIYPAPAGFHSHSR